MFNVPTNSSRSVLSRGGVFSSFKKMESQQNPHVSRRPVSFLPFPQRRDVIQDIQDMEEAARVELERKRDSEEADLKVPPTHEQYLRVIYLGCCRRWSARAQAMGGTYHVCQWRAVTHNLYSWHKFHLF